MRRWWPKGSEIAATIERMIVHVPMRSRSQLQRIGAQCQCLVANLILSDDESIPLDCKQARGQVARCICFSLPLSSRRPLLLSFRSLGCSGRLARVKINKCHYENKAGRKCAAEIRFARAPLSARLPVAAAAAAAGSIGERSMNNIGHSSEKQAGALTCWLAAGFTSAFQVSAAPTALAYFRRERAGSCCETQL